MSSAPCRGSSNCLLFFIVALTGRLPFVFVYPGRCPGLWKHWAFSPSLRKRYWLRPCNSMWLPLPTSYIPILVSFVFLLVKLFLRPDFCYVICSGCVRDAFGMIVGFLSLLSSLIFSSLLLAARPNGATSPQPRATPWV